MFQIIHCISLLAIATVTKVSSMPSPESPEHYFKITGRQFIHVKKELLLPNATDECFKNHAEPAILRSQYELDCLTKDGINGWIGMKCSQLIDGQSPTYKWNNGQPVAYGSFDEQRTKVTCDNVAGVLLQDGKYQPVDHRSPTNYVICSEIRNYASEVLFPAIDALHETNYGLNVSMGMLIDEQESLADRFEEQEERIESVKDVIKDEYEQFRNGTIKSVVIPELRNLSGDHVRMKQIIVPLVESQTNLTERFNRIEDFEEIFLNESKVTVAEVTSIDSQMKVVYSLTITVSVIAIAALVTVVIFIFHSLRRSRTNRRHKQFKNDEAVHDL